MTAGTLALLLTLVPLAAGALLARAVPRQAGTTRRAAALHLAALLGATALGFLIALATRVTVWDGAWAGAALGLGWATVRAPRVALLALGLAAAFGLGEVAARSRPLGLPVPADRRLRIPAIDLTHLEHGNLAPDLTRGLFACGLAFPQALPGPAQARLPRGGDPRGVTLVLGDSMSAGLDPDPADTWPDLLRQRHPAVAVVSAALVGGSIDLHWAVLRAWRPLLGPRLRHVVLQLFVNDPMEISRPWDCCGARPLIDFDHRTAAARLACDRPRWQGGALFSWRWRVRVSPLPMAVRAAGPWSMLARRLLNDHYHWQTAIPFLPDGRRGMRTRFAEALRGFAREARGLDVAVVVIPWRPALDPTSPHHDEALRTHTEIIADARAAGLRVLDPTEALRERARARGEAALFLPNGEHHFSDEGHATIADWVDRELPGFTVATRGQ